jgi:uncharacterized protein YjbI with pentapeptide repeats
MTDPVKLIRSLGRGASPASVGLGQTPEGYVDVRKLELPRSEPTGWIPAPTGGLEIGRDSAVFRRLSLHKIDLSGSRITYSLWLNCQLEDVNLDYADARMIAISRGRLHKVSFRRTDLSGSAWGLTGRGGPLISDCIFLDSNLNKSAYSHPLFRNCQFETILERVMFNGASFENCVFAGTLKDVWFDRTHGDPNPFLARRVNTMKNVDFSRARMVSVSFKGIDLTSARLPVNGHAIVHRPRLAFERVLHRVNAEWVGADRTEAKTFLERQLGYQIRISDTTFVFSPHYFLEMSLTPKVAERLLKELLSASNDLNPTS